MNKISKVPWAGIFLMILALLILAAIFYSGFGLVKVPVEFKTTAEIALPVLVLVGAIGLFITLALVAAFFAAMGQSDRSQALGLPAGSVRALIALFLITLFAIAGVFLYRQMRIPVKDSITTQYIGIDRQEFAKIPTDQIVAIEVRTEEQAGAEQTVYDVTRRIPAVETNEASQKFAQQIFTALSTLVIAIVGFYFGTRSIAAARGETVKMAPRVDYIKPEKGDQNQERVEITNLSGAGFIDGAKVRLRRDNESNDIEASETQVASPSKITCILNLKDRRVGKWDVIVINPDGTEGKKAEAFEITQ